MTHQTLQLCCVQLDRKQGHPCYNPDTITAWTHAHTKELSLFVPQYPNNYSSLVRDIYDSAKWLHKMLQVYRNVKCDRFSKKKHHMLWTTGCLLSAAHLLIPPVCIDTPSIIFLGLGGPAGGLALMPLLAWLVEELKDSLSLFQRRRYALGPEHQPSNHISLSWKASTRHYYIILKQNVSSHQFRGDQKCYLCSQQSFRKSCTLGQTLNERC